MRTLSEITHRLRRTLRKKGQSAEAAEDIVQDAMLRFEIYRRERQVDDQEAFITRTALNLATDVGRRFSRSPVQPSTPDHFDFVDPAPNQADTFWARQSLERLKVGLAALDPKTQAVILAHRLDGLTYAEIARREGVSESAVVKRVARGVLYLQKWMDEW